MESVDPEVAIPVASPRCAVKVQAIMVEITVFDTMPKPTAVTPP